MTYYPIVSGPVPAYSNVPIQPQNFKPSVFDISAIALGVQTLVTTTTNMNYVIGQLTRLIIPPSFGCRQLNEAEGYVLSIPNPNQVLLSINSSQNVDAFILSSASTVAQIKAIGDINNGITSSTGRSVPTTNIPGAFINIS